MRRKTTGLLILAAMVLGGCGMTETQITEDTPATETVVVEEVRETEADKSSVETEEETEDRGNIKKNTIAGPELEAYANYIYEEGFLGENADRDIYFPQLAGAEDARFLYRDIDGDGVAELYLNGTIGEAGEFYPAYCLLDCEDGKVQVLSEQYYQQRMNTTFLNNNYLCRYEEGMPSAPFCYPQEGLSDYNPDEDEWIGLYDDLYLWSPDPGKEEIHLSSEGGGYYHGEQYVACPRVYIFNGEEITEEEYLELENRYTEDAIIPASEFRPLSKENLLAGKVMQGSEDAEAGEKENDVDLMALLESIEGDYADDTDPELPRMFTIGRDGMNWIGGYPVTAEDVVDYGEDYILFQEESGSYYKVMITKDALFISYGKTPAALAEGAVIDRSTRSTY